ncbi:GroES-like family protein [Citrus sinensis]|uniref:GroES-like family protein n=1 Tax=Citrus sinensis TaxID=2711 RepID=A0ACB8NAH7_CITSI|nr:GroES-like family protein [Citrus sinensis]
MAKRLIPTLNRVLVEKIVPPSKTNAGILLPEKSSKASVVLQLFLSLITRMRLNSGKVIAVGPGARDKEGNTIPVAFKEGDTVLLPNYGGDHVKLGEKEPIVEVRNILIQGPFVLCKPLASERFVDLDQRKPDMC